MNALKSRLGVLLLGASLMFSSCDFSEGDNNTSDEIIDLSVDNNGAKLSQMRITYRHEPLFDEVYDAEYKSSTIVSKKATTVLSTGNSKESYVLIADVSSPVQSDNRPLSATHVSIIGNYAYVSYHYNEDNNTASSIELYEGQIDVLDISAPSLPVILSAASTKSADFNTMSINNAISNQKIWLGASDFNVGGAIYELNLVNNDIPSNATLLRHKLEYGASVNGIAQASNYLFATAGRTLGGSYTFDLPSMNLNDFSGYSNAKYVAVTGTTAGSKKVVLVSGNNAQLKIYEVGGNQALLKTIDIGSIQPETGKSGLYIKDGLCWVSMGYAGLKAYNIETGDEVYTLSPSSMGAKAVTNGVALDDDYIYVANGDGGMYICEAIEGQQELSVLEIYNYGASANYINVGNNLIFIANGKEGLKILRRLPKGNYNVICDYDENGVPECMEDNAFPICSNLLANIAAVLPEYVDQKTSHPEYFTYPQSLILNEEATVYITFINEGAGFKNSFGAYTYDANNPPATAAEITNQQLIYPNASKLHSGGALVPGATMRLLGTFPANTQIGTFLLANSWVGLDNVPGGLREALYTHYSETAYNYKGYPQSLLFYDASCNAIISTFEDLRSNVGDKDFNDCIVQITIEPASAVDVSQFMQIGQ